MAVEVKKLNTSRQITRDSRIVKTWELKVLIFYCTFRTCLYGNHASGNGILGWHSRVMEGGTLRLILGLAQQTQFCVSFIDSFPLFENGNFQTTQRCQF